MNRFLKLILAVLFAVCCCGNARAQLYVAYYNAGVVSQYDADTGALISEHFILGLKQPRALCLANGCLYVAQTSDGSIAKYDAQTGATINDRFITGLNMPQRMAVTGNAIYVASFAWTAPGGFVAENLIGKYDATSGAAINYSLVKTSSSVTTLAVAGNNLFVSCDNSRGLLEYDATSGALITDHFARPLSTADSMVASDQWLWIMVGSNYGMIFKFNAKSGESALTHGIFPFPLIQKLNYPSMLAVSGNNLYVGGGGSTGVDKYNATTGELIKSALVPPLADRFGGIAVVPTAAVPEVSWKETQFEAKNDFMNFLFWLSTNGDYLSLGSGVLVVIAVLGFGAMFFFRRASQPPAPAVVEAPVVENALAEPMPEPVEAAPPDVQVSSPPTEVEEPAPIEEPSAKSRSMSPLTMVMLGLFGMTLALAGLLAWLASQASDITQPRQEDTKDLIGIWGFENITRQANEMPIMLTLQVYSTRLEFSSGSGTRTQQGQWHDDGFWCQKPDGSGEVEVARIVSPEEIEFHLSAFDPGDQTVSVLYKQRGNDAEMQAIAARYPPPITYPPPAGVIKYWMTEYELTSLPWKVDHIEVPDDEPYARRIIYVYRSDNPHLDKLEVTIKNHRVVEIKGGNG